MTLPAGNVITIDLSSFFGIGGDHAEDHVGGWLAESPGP